MPNTEFRNMFARVVIVCVCLGLAACSDDRQRQSSISDPKQRAIVEVYHVSSRRPGSKVLRMELRLDGGVTIHSSSLSTSLKSRSPAMSSYASEGSWADVGSIRVIDCGKSWLAFGHRNVSDIPIVVSQSGAILNAPTGIVDALTEFNVPVDSITMHPLPPGRYWIGSLFPNSRGAEKRHRSPAITPLEPAEGSFSGDSSTDGRISKELDESMRKPDLDHKSTVLRWRSDNPVLFRAPISDVLVDAICNALHEKSIPYHALKLRLGTTEIRVPVTKFREALLVLVGEICARRSRVTLKDFNRMLQELSSD